MARSIRRQLNDLKKQLGELSSDANLTVEEKVRRQQEIRQQIMDLQNQLRQHQMDQRKEQLEEKTRSVKPSDQKAGLEAVISADSAVKNARVQESAAARMEGRARVIKSEIEMDGGRGAGSIPSKRKELARAERTADEAKAAQMQNLGKINQQMQSAAKAEESQQKTEDVKDREDEQEKRGQEEQSQAKTLRYDSDGKPVLEEKEPRMLGRA